MVATPMNPVVHPTVFGLSRVLTSPPRRVSGLTSSAARTAGSYSSGMFVPPSRSFRPWLVRIDQPQMLDSTPGAVKSRPSVGRWTRRDRMRYSVPCEDGAVERDRVPLSRPGVAEGWDGRGAARDG